MKPLSKSVFGIALVLTLWTQAQGQANAQIKTKPIRAERLQAGETISLDGTLNDPAWQRASVHEDFMEREPQYGRGLEHKTRLRILYDDKALYAGVEALDPDPSQIRVNQVRYDQVFRTQDFLALFIDAQGDRKAAQFFRVNAQGYTGDGLHTAADDQEDFLPDYDFSAAAKITSQGFTAVFRIPFTSLRYDPKSTKPWTVMLVRRLPREDIKLIMSVNLPRDAAHFLREMQVLENFTPPALATSLVVKPTITLRSIEERTPVASRENKAKPSLDFKWQPRNELVVDGTINPDFSQVELDVIELSRNSKFALFKQEKRPTFLESRDLISVQNNAIYTRAITDPRWALRSTWRDDSLSGSVIATQDKGGGLTIVPGTYYNSYATQPANDTLIARGIYNDVGLVLARRQYADNRGANTVLGLDRNLEINSSWRTRLQALVSRTDALANDNGELVRGQTQNGAFLSGNVQYSSEKLNGGVDVNYLTKKFRNDVGFTTQTGEYDLSGWTAMRFRNPAWSKLDGNSVALSLIEPQVSYGLVRDTANNKTLRAWITPGIYIETPGGIESKVELRAISIVRPSESTRLLHEKYVFQWFSLPINKVVQSITGNYDWGQLTDYSVEKVRPGQRVSISAKIRPFAFKNSPLADRLELEPSANLLRLNTQGKAISNESSTRLLALLHVAPGQSLRLITQNSRYTRKAEAAFAVSDDFSRTQTQSLTYIWRQSINDALYIGGSRSNTQSQNAAKTESREFFVKWQKQI
jgi:hypothetical protein